jgi:hypothetical protein
MYQSCLSDPRIRLVRAGLDGRLSSSLRGQYNTNEAGRVAARATAQTERLVVQLFASGLAYGGMEAGSRAIPAAFATAWKTTAKSSFV